MKIVINMDRPWTFMAEPVEGSALQFLPLSDDDWKDYQRVHREWRAWQGRLEIGIQPGLWN